MNIPLNEEEKKNFEERVHSPEFKRKNQKGYPHFDRSICYHFIEKQLRDEQWICRYPFYPFIQFDKNYDKYGYYECSEKEVLDEGLRKRIKKKTRTLSYCAHRDRWIYSFYSELINIKYNTYVREHGIDDSAIAYRVRFDDQRAGNQNISFANSVFSFITERENCIIIAGDFTKFFDNLSHKYLKKRLIQVLYDGVHRKNGEIGLSADMYHIFKSITRYAYCTRNDIIAFKYFKCNGGNNRYDKQEHQRKRELRIQYFEKNTENKLSSRLMTREEFNEFRNYKIDGVEVIKTNKNIYGIPQGSPISAVLSNVYMIEFDSKMKSLVDEYHGLYMRYSDDFIVVVPCVCGIDEKILWNQINNIIGEINQEENSQDGKNGCLKISEDKVEIFNFREKHLTDVTGTILENSGGEKKTLDYLGFSFDGEDITIRQKSIGKYRYRMIRKARNVGKNRIRNGGFLRAELKKLYDIYSPQSKHDGEKGDNRNAGRKRKNNFFTYVKRASQIMNVTDLGISYDKQKVKREIRKFIHQGERRELMKVNKQ